MSCGVGPRHSLDPELLWLWGRPAAAAPMRPLGWEPPCATREALKKQKKKKKRKKEKKKPKKTKQNKKFEFYLGTWFLKVHMALNEKDITSIVPSPLLTGWNRDIIVGT